MGSFLWPTAPAVCGPSGTHLLSLDTPCSVIMGSFLRPIAPGTTSWSTCCADLLSLSTPCSVIMGSFLFGHSFWSAGTGDLLARFCLSCSILLAGRLTDVLAADLLEISSCLGNKYTFAHPKSLLLLRILLYLLKHPYYLRNNHNNSSLFTNTTALTDYFATHAAQLYHTQRHSHWRAPGPQPYIVKRSPFTYLSHTFSFIHIYWVTNCC